MTTQFDIIQLLKKYKPNKLSTGEIKEKLKVRGQITNQLRQLRHYKMVKFETKIIATNKTRKEGYVYWVF